METKHTPWKVAVRFQNNLPNDYIITDGKWGSPAIAACDNKEDAELIVRAVNCHEELLANLKMLVFGITNGVEIPKGGAAVIVAKQVIKKCEQAIAKAGGK